MMVGGTIKDVGSTARVKTGSWRTFRPVVTEKCIGCGTCVGFCPEGIISLEDVKDKSEGRGKKKAEIDYDYCKGCLICREVCPVKAIICEVEKKQQK